MNGLDYKTWTDEYFPAPEFNRSAFQAELDRICGLARGQQKIRLVFGSEEEHVKEGQISDLGLGLNLHKEGRYRTRKDGRMVRIRRWIFEEWQPPEQIRIEQNFVMLPGAGFYVPPHHARIAQKGDYNLVYVVADHSRCNCAPEDYSCMGEYRAPSARDLKHFMRVTAAIQAKQIKQDPFSPMSQDMVSRLQQAENQKLVDAEAEKWRAVDERIDDRAATRKKHSVSGKG